MKNNKNIFSTREFDNWVKREELLPEEKIVIEKFLCKNSKTIEAGTASGRILLEMSKLGFQNLFGYDFITEYIEAAKNRDSTKRINFSVQDATKLNYDEASFDQAIYLQQITSTIESEELRITALKEAHRILKSSGMILFSFLSFESKQNNLLFKALFPILKIIRLIKREKISMQYLPWLKYSGRINWSALLDRRPYNYWFKVDEICNILEQTGFEVIFLGYPKDIINNKLNNSYWEASLNKADGHLFIVCKKK